MSDFIMLLAVFDDIEPAAEGIEKLHGLGLQDDQMNVISGVPIKGCHFGAEIRFDLCFANCLVRRDYWNGIWPLSDLWHPVLVPFARGRSTCLSGAHGYHHHLRDDHAGPDGFCVPGHAPG